MDGDFGGCDGDGGLDLDIGDGGLDLDLDGSGGLGLDLDADSLVSGVDLDIDIGSGSGGCDFGYDGMDGCTVGNATTHNARLRGQVDNERRLFGVHVVKHGDIDVKAAFARVAERLGLIRFHPHRVAGKAIDNFEPTLLPLTTWNKSVPSGTMPDGHYKEATGTTVVWRQYWQVGRRAYLWSKPVYDRTALVHLEVVCITWYYREAGDYETRLLVRVVPRNYQCPVSHQVGFRREPLAAHVRTAKTAAEQLFDQVSARKPDAVSRRLRERLPAPRPKRLRAMSADYSDADRTATSGADLDSALESKGGAAVAPIRLVIALPVAFGRQRAMA